ncbi:uncharacterized protein LOC122506214 [Leptopilina heterotoma]|uniref:uncharacterized protein LOC122506214 n=1 Tax=Leptopilina heterotoma TaxID=63436 RepID=UPI001CA8F8F2|nr:uncharacterized protein LOC122506214 [Leptopilina heterotoma]
MSDIDAKVNMSLDEIIKLDKKKKKSGVASVKGGVKKSRGLKPGIQGGNQRPKKQNQSQFKKIMSWRQGTTKLRGGFVRKRYNKKGGIVRSRSSLNLNRNFKTYTREAFSVNRGFGPKRRAVGNRLALNRNKSQINPSFGHGGFFINRSTLKGNSNSMSNLRDPNSVYNRLGYQSPAQIAYRNRVKRAKQLLLQRQNQRMNLQNAIGMAGGVKSLRSLQQRALERRQQILTSQNRFNIGGLRSDQIVRAQRRQQYEQKLLRLNSTQMNANSNVNFTCTLGSPFSHEIGQQPLSLSQRQNSENIGNPHQLSRGRSTFRQSMQNLNVLGRNQSFTQQRRSRSRSRSRNRSILSLESSLNMDDRSFSEVMYSLSGNLGVTGRTLNDRFSF